MIVRDYFPEVIQKIFPQYTWRSKNNRILITFDDGPGQYTPDLLQSLSDKQIKAVFFCTGKNATRYPGMLKEIQSEGHLIGSHGMNHINGWKISGNRYYDEIYKSANYLADISGMPVFLYRPPYGKLRFFIDKRLQKADLKPVIWSLLTMDYQNNEDIVKFVIQKYLKSNSIVVLHDRQENIKVTLKALEEIEKVVLRKGFEFGVPAECLNLSLL